MSGDLSALANYNFQATFPQSFILDNQIMNMETGRNLLQSIFFNLKYADPMLGIYGLHDAGFGVYTARPSLQHIHGGVVVLSHYQNSDVFEQFLKNPVPFDLFCLSVCSENSFSTMSQFQF